MDNKVRLYHGSGIKINDGVIRARPAHINNMQTEITAVFATPSYTHAKLYAIMRLVGVGRRAPRETDALYIDELNPNIPKYAYVYELDSGGFQRDIDGSYYCLHDKPITREPFCIDIIQEIRQGKLKVYVLKGALRNQNMSDEKWQELLNDKSNFELYNPDA